MAPRRTRTAPARARRLAAAAALAFALAFPAAAAAQDNGPTAFDRDGVWIWYVTKSSRGNPDAIAARAQAAGVGTVFVKSSDGSRWWGQFSPGLVSALHARGLDVCAWQFVYGKLPSAEATLGARAVRSGADCLVIDAESRYEGRYKSAGTYVNKLRRRIGTSYPVGLAGFPYVDYHPSFPYSVFMGPRGAQFNLPQMYWAEIGVSVDEVFDHTFRFNSLYKRPIYPLGQLYGRATPADVVRFRELARNYGTHAVSWWSWQSASAGGWSALAQPVTTFAQAPAPPTVPPTLSYKARGDLVVWAQQHLVAAGQPMKIDGVFGWATALGVQGFQQASGLPVTGTIDPATWSVLLNREPARAPWSPFGSPSSGTGTVSAAGSAAPRSAHQPAVRDEIGPPAQRR